MTNADFERQHELAAYQLQLVILERDLAKGKFQALLSIVKPGATLSDIFTADIKAKLSSLRNGAEMERITFSRRVYR
jgi:hypothetical protein